MKQPTTEGTKRMVFEADEHGRLFSPQMREALSERVPPEGLATAEAFAAMGLASRQLRARMERWCETEGLSETRLGILFMLHHVSAGVPLGALAANLHVSARNVTGLIDHLERDGLVARTPDPADRRSVLAELTDEGRARAETMRGEAFRYQQVLLTGFSDEELLQLRHLCLKLASRMEEEPDLPK